MNLIRWKALYFYHVLTFLFFTCYCTSCREQSSDKKSQTKSAHDEAASATSRVDTVTLLTQADLLFQLGETYSKSDQDDSSLFYHEQALVLRERAGKKDKDMFDSYVRVGQFYAKALKFDIADTYYEKAQLVIGDQNLSFADESLFLLDFSYIKLNLNDIPSSISLLNRLILKVDTNRVTDKEMIGRIHISLGNAYVYDNQLDAAIWNYKKALAYFEQSNNNQRAGLALVALGMTYNRKQDDRNALDNFGKAIQKHLKWTTPDSNELAKVYLQKAGTHEHLGELDSAQYYYQWNLRIRKKIFGEKNTNTFGAKFTLGLFYENRHQYDSAAKYAHESLISLVKNFDEHDLQSNPKPDPTELNIDLVLGLVNKASALQHLSEQTNNQESADLSLKTFLFADSVFTVFRQNLKYDDPQLRELEAGDIPYHQMVELSFQLFQKTRNDDYLRKSIQIMEKSRAVLLESALNRSHVYDTTAISHQWVNEENELAANRSEILRRLSLTNLSTATSDSLGEALLKVNGLHAQLKESIEKNNPNYFNLRFNQKEISLEEIQSLLKERNSVLIEFLWSESKIYTIAISPTKIDTRIILKDDSFNVSFNNFIAQLQAPPEEAIKKKNFDLFSQSAFVLYNSLLADLLPKNTDRNRAVNLIISANGPLATIPFEALITRLPSSSDVNYQLPYLVQSFPVGYTYSPGILLTQSKREREGNKLLALGFAGKGPTRTQRHGLSNLPGTEMEINSIKEVMNNNANKYYVEKEASESMFKNKVKDFDIVHLAIHGVADSANALESKLIFRSETDSLEDSNLYAHELYNLDLAKLDLAVLSACESGIGKQQAGEGVMSIARGFAYAGCPSLVISLWKIDDRTSARVMSDFYKHVSIGEQLDKALAQAKIDYLATAQEFNSHPSYWAAFLQMGDTRAIDAGEFDWKIVAVVICLVAILALFFWRKAILKKGDFDQPFL